MERSAESPKKQESGEQGLERVRAENYQRDGIKEMESSEVVSEEIIILSIGEQGRR